MLSDPKPVVTCYYFHYFPGNWVWLHLLCAVQIWEDLPTSAGYLDWKWRYVWYIFDIFCVCTGAGCLDLEWRYADDEESCSTACHHLFDRSSPSGHLIVQARCRDRPPPQGPRLLSLVETLSTTLAKKRGGWWWGGSALTSYYHTALGTWLCCIAPKCTPLQVSNTLSSLSSKEEMWISFINSCLHVKPWQTTQFSIFVPLVCFFC